MYKYGIMGRKKDWMHVRFLNLSILKCYVFLQEFTIMENQNLCEKSRYAQKLYTLQILFQIAFLLNLWIYMYMYLPV